MPLLRTPLAYAGLSVAAALGTLVLKTIAWRLTDSVGLLSDAAESLVNLAAASLALLMLWVSRMPADTRHPYGHGKAEYFSSGAEGVLILVAAAGIIWASMERFLNPAPVTELAQGLGISMVSTAINLVVARVLLRGARRFDTIALEADSHHLMTDVWTTVALVAALAVLLVTPPSWSFLDPLIGLVMALNIARTGFGLIRRSASALLDSGLPEAEQAIIEQAIREHAPLDYGYHGLRSRKAGTRRFVDYHLVVPGDMSVREAHDLTHAIDRDIRERLTAGEGALPVQITSHIEPNECPTTWDCALVGGTCGTAKIGRCPGGPKAEASQYVGACPHCAKCNSECAQTKDDSDAAQ